MSRKLSLVLLLGLGALAVGGCSKDACEVDTSGPECHQTFTLDLPDNCPPTDVALSTFYSRIINASCATLDCHGGTQFPTYGPDDPSIFVDQVLHRAPSRDAMPLLKYVKPRNPDNSFLLYKVVQSPITGMTQQGKIQLGGSAMPKDRPPLSADDQCTLLNWVRSGAN